MFRAVGAASEYVSRFAPDLIGAGATSVRSAVRESQQVDVTFAHEADALRAQHILNPEVVLDDGARVGVRIMGAPSVESTGRQALHPDEVSRFMERFTDRVASARPEPWGHNPYVRISPRSAAAADDLTRLFRPQVELPGGMLEDGRALDVSIRGVTRA